MAQTDRIDEVPPVIPGLFTPQPYGEDTPARLLGGYCPACHGRYFPKPRYCPGCLGEVEERDMGATGRIHSFTVVRTKAPLGLPQPYSIGYIDMDGSGLRIFCLLDHQQIDRLRIGAEVVLKVLPMGINARQEPCLRPVFTLRAERRGA